LISMCSRAHGWRASCQCSITGSVNRVMLGLTLCCSTPPLGHPDPLAPHRESSAVVEVVTLYLRDQGTDPALLQPKLRSVSLCRLRFEWRLEPYAQHSNSRLTCPIRRCTSSTRSSAQPTPAAFLDSLLCVLVVIQKSSLNKIHSGKG
jgi:hypothetical protein